MSFQEIREAGRSASWRYSVWKVTVVSLLYGFGISVLLAALFPQAFSGDNSPLLFLSTGFIAVITAIIIVMRSK